MSVLVCAGAGVRHGRRWVFRDLEILVEPGDLIAVTGPPGSGRTTALLALAGRFRLSEGSVDLVDAGAALGFVPGVTDPEPVMTVAEHIRERRALLGLPKADVPLLGLDPAAKGWQLSRFDRQLLGIVLALMEEPQVIALDGIDEGLDAGERRRLRQVLREVAATGVAVIVTARHLGEGDEEQDEDFTTEVRL
ncbi:ATP-binding cassette domain-containing protein [Actinoplanes sp. NPDC051633]|uniref:ABC transporter ATP-binding protein n=1 Tax=Actinoplanes sp. NPDC051633 TaxID=3155670 RepID=UPI00341455F5